MFLTEKELKDKSGRTTITLGERYDTNLNLRSGKEMQIW